MTLFDLLAGEIPFKFFRQRGRAYHFNVESVPTITPQLREVIDRATEPLPGDRYSSAKELAKALVSCL